MIEEIDIEEEFSQDSEEVAALAEEQSALVEYVPKSKAPYRLNTLIPRNMAFEVQKALNRVVKLRGNIDNYVRNQLKYSSAEAMWKGLGAEQVDAVGMYLFQFEQDQGLIIADQTGIGKGRQAAAVIRHAIVNDYLPVFFTRKPDLFSDMYRDLKSIDHADIQPFIVNTNSDANVKDADGSVVFSPLSGDEQKELLSTSRTVPIESQESVDWHRAMGKKLPDPEKQPTIELTESIDYLPSEYNCIFVTYSQVQAAAPYKKLWVSQLVKSGIEGSKKYKKVVFILDESHMAGGFDSIVGGWMRGVLPSTKACCFLSATFAKYPQVMPFYAKKTAIAETGMRDGTFVGAMERGGLALQEIVASNLAESGQLVRRQRSNEGILVDYITLDKEPESSLNRERVNRVVHIMNQIVVFEDTFITPLLEEIHRDTKSKGEHLEKPPRSLGVKNAPYFSRVFGIVDQLLFALKVEEVAKKTIELLQEDKKVVIAFKSTMGTFLKDLNLVSGDVVLPEQLDFIRTLIKGLESVFYYSYTQIDGTKSRERILLESLPQSGIDQYHAIVSSIKAESSGLTITPIDKLIQIVQDAPKRKGLGGHQGKHFKVAEVTGRNQRVHFDKGEAVIQSFRTDTEKFFRLFNNGDYDVLLINQSGSTGSSAHASEDFKDQRVRAMIIHQFELDINTEVQKRGRINRTGQVVLPEYYYITSDIPAEQRMMTMLKGKLKSLDANTTGSQKTNDDTLKSIDFFNKYGNKVAWEWVNDNPELTDQMGKPTYHKEKDKYGTRWVRNEGKEGAIKQVTGRAGLLRVEQQDVVYADLIRRYHHQIEWEKQQGTYDLEVEFLKLDAEVKKRYLYKKGNGGKTPFGKDTVRDETIVNNLKRPFTKAQVDERIDKALQGKKPIEVQTTLVDEVNKKYPEIAKGLTQRRKDTIEKIKQEIAQLPNPDEEEDDEKSEKLERNKKQLEEQLQTKQKSLQEYEHELEQIKTYIIQGIEAWKIGDVVKIPLVGSVFHKYGIYLGANIKKANNPYTLGNVNLVFAVADQRKIIEYNLTPEQRGMINSIHVDSKEVTEEEILTVQQDWNNLVKDASKKREKRLILTENIVASSNEIGTMNKLIKYNTQDGVIKNGILLSVEYNDEQNPKALFPISHALDSISKLAVDELFSDHELRVKFKRISDKAFQILISKKGNQSIFTDEILRTLIMKAEGQSTDELADFVQNAGDMTAPIHIDKLQRFLERLDAFDLHYMGEAKELEDWEIENEEEWNKDKQEEEIHRYKLKRSYGQGSNPISGFVNYQEATSDFPFGVVEYNRALKDSEKFNYSLVPVFVNVEQPYLLWKAYIEQAPALKADLTVTLEQAKKEPIAEAILTLGYFITNNPHEDGNQEFVFGEYLEEDLGRMAYEDLIGFSYSLEILIQQLEIELAA